MIIDNAMINGKEVLEMQMNNSIVYSSAPALHYNYTLDFVDDKIATPPPTWFKTINLVNNSTNVKFVIKYGRLINVLPSQLYGSFDSNIGIDISEATTDIKITVNCYKYNQYNLTSSTSRITFGGTTPSTFDKMNSSISLYTNQVYILNEYRDFHDREDHSVTIPLSSIQQIYTKGYMPALQIYHSNGQSTNYSEFQIYSIKIEEV